MIEKLQQYASAASSQAAGSGRDRAAAEEPLAPLECSQRAVIRSLTVQLADLRRQLVQLSTGKLAWQRHIRIPTMMSNSFTDDLLLIKAAGK